MSHDRTGKPVVCRDTSHEQGQEIQRQNTENEQSQRNSRPYWNCRSWRFTRKKADLIITYWRRWWKEVWSRIYESRIWSEKRKLLHTTGSVLKLTVAVSVTISISVQKWHSRIRLRFFSCNRMKRPEVREEECPCGRMCRWPCKDYVKGMCIDSFWKVAPSRILVLQDSKVEADLGKSALMRIVSLMNNLLKGPRGIISSHVEEEWFARKRMATCCQLWQVTSDRGDPISIVTPVMSWSEDLFNADHRTHGIWVVFQDMKPPKSILRKSSDMKKPIQRVKITKAIARRTKIRDQNSSIGYSEVFKNWMKRSGSRKFILLEHKIIYFFMNSYWSRDLREAHHKSQWNGRIDDISVFYIRHHCKKNIGRRSRYYPWTYWQDTGFAKWNELYEWFEKFFKIGGCWQRGGNLWDAVEYECTGSARLDFCEPIKGWSKTTKTNFCQINHKFLLVGEKIWTDIQPQDYSPTDYSLSTKLIILLCHGCLPREDDGSFEFLRMNDNLQKHVQHRHRWADEKWRTEWEEEEDKKKISVLSRFFRNNSVFPGISKVILDATLWIIHHKTMSLFWTVSSSSLTMLDMQSICIPSSIQGWYQDVKFWATDRQYSFCLWIFWTKNTSILTRSSWKHRALHIHAESMEETSESYVLGDINIALKKGLKYQTQSNAIILYETLPAYCIPKVVRMETWEVVNEKVFASLRLPPKISLQHDWMK